MGIINMSPTQRLSVVIGISFSFFVAEISVGFYTHSLALIADAFHYLNDLVGFIVALLAIQISRRGKSPKEFSFGWQRAQLLGAFFNGVFLAALGLSIFLQAVERFVSLTRVDQPKLVLVVGAVGLTLNIISAAFLHEHGHDHGHSHGHGHENQPSSGALEAARLSFNAAGPGVHANHRHMTNSNLKGKGRDLGVLGVFIHVVGDAINNIGVIASAAAIWWGKTEGRFYADPAVSMGISLMIFATSIPLVKNSGKILLQSAPAGVYVEEVRKDLEELPGISSVHELHVWRLDQQKTIASVHILTDNNLLDHFMEQAQQIGECLHAYGVHSFTVQPELTTALHTNTTEATPMDTSQATGQAAQPAASASVTCRIKCQEGGCEEPQCCN